MSNTGDQATGSVVVERQGSGDAAGVAGSGAGQPIPAPAAPNSGEKAANQDVELVPIERVKHLQSANDRLRSRIGELEQQLADVGAAAETARQESGEASATALANLRRALIAEQAGQVVPELIVGDSAEALVASVEQARAAFARAAEATRASLGAQVVPAGTPVRTPRSLEGATPLQRIVDGLNR
jgi:hypothetical protein